MEQATMKRPIQRPVLEEGPEGGVMVKVPFPLLPLFKEAFPYARWNAYGKVWVVPSVVPRTRAGGWRNAKAHHPGKHKNKPKAGRKQAMGRIKTAMAMAMAGVLVAGSALAQNTGFDGGSTNGGGAGGGTGGGSSAGGGATGSWGVENSGSALDEICNLALWFYEGSLPIVYVMAVIGLVMMAIKMMATGKFEMTNFFWWGTVLVFLSGTPAVLLLLTQGDVSSLACAV